MSKAKDSTLRRSLAELERADRTASKVLKGILGSAQGANINKSSTMVGTLGGVTGMGIACAIGLYFTAVPGLVLAGVLTPMGILVGVLVVRGRN